MLSNYSQILPIWLYSTINVHAGDKLFLDDFKSAIFSKYRLVEFTFTKKKSQITFSVDSFYTVKKPWPALFVWIHKECQCSTPSFLVFIWHPGLADIRQRPYDVFLICGIKDLARAFCRMWTCCNRNYTKRLTEREREREGAREKSVHDMDTKIFRWFCFSTSCYLRVIFLLSLISSNTT